MAHAPYNLLLARRVPRPYGGYENSYTVSNHGWSRISYLQCYPARAKKPVAGNSPQEEWAAMYLLGGKGEENDLKKNLTFKIFGIPMFPRLPPQQPLDEVGLLLRGLDPVVRAASEAVCMIVDSPQNDCHKTVDRALYLQRRGLIPQDVNVALFVLNAYERGSSSSAILFSLLLRGGMRLRDELTLSKFFSFVTERVHAAQHATSRTAPAGCENCHRYEKLLEAEKLHTQSLKEEISSLRTELVDSLVGRQQLHMRNSQLRNHIATMSQSLGLVTEGLEKIKNPPITLLPVKAYINYALAGIVLMNYLAT
jgi:hypothetical protein